MILYKEYINIDTEVSNLRSINNNRTLITYEVIFFITKDSYMYGAENIFLKTIKEKKTKNKLTKSRLKKNVVPIKHFYNNLESIFFKSSHFENAKSLNTSNYFRTLYLENSFTQKNLLIKPKNDDKGYSNSKIKQTCINKLSNRAPPL